MQPLSLFLRQGGYEVIKKAIEKLADKHAEHIAAYGEGNERRLTGRHETASIDKFSWGVANRGASVRVGRQVEAEGKGYFEDRRPSSNMDPYVVTSMIVKVRLPNVAIRWVDSSRTPLILLFHDPSRYSEPLAS